MSYHVEVLADCVSAIDPVTGGQYTRQVRICMTMSREQRRCAVATMLAAMPEQEAYDWLRGEFPAWFPVPEPEVHDSSFGEFEAARGAA